MGSPAGGALRVLRTVAITAVIVGLAVTAHVVGGGQAPRLPALAALALATAYVCAWTARHRLSLPLVIALLAGGQWTLHHALDLAATRACAQASVAVHAGHAPAGCAPGEPGGLDVAASHAAPATPAMLAAHVVATLLTALVLASGERALWALCTLLAALLPVVPRLRAVLPAAPRPVAPAAASRPRRVLLLRTSPRRGPPAPVPGPLARLAG